ncbi:MAG: TonB-dependent receptor plug domain-containing protein [Desulfobulbaceae bacterium]
MYKHYSFAILITLALLAPAPLSAAVQQGEDVQAFEQVFGKGPQEEDVYRADRLLVTATGSLKPVYLAPSVASVITKEDIEATGATTLDEALETVPGLHVFPNGTMLMEPNWSIRGIQAGLNPQVLLLINGFPLSHSVQGNRPIGLQMPVSMISRIEVVRGPGSAVHGADAFAGTINVITKDGQEVDGSRAGIRYGSFDTSDTWLQHGGNYRGWDVALGLDWQKTSGDDNRIIERDGLGSGPPSLAPGPLDTRHESLDTSVGLRKGRWTLHAYSTLIEAGMGHGGAQILSENSEISTKLFQGDLSYDRENFLPEWDLTLKGYSIYNDNNNYFDFYPDSLGVNAIGNPFGNEWDSGLEATTVYKGFTDHRLRLACGFIAKDVDTNENKNFGAGISPASQFGALINVNDTPYIFLDDQNRFLWYLSAQDEWTLARHWELTAGVRYDHYSDFSATTNPRAALVWEARYDLTAKIMYGRAFRAPTFAEQYFQNNPITIGNPDIDPETINTYELALDYQPTNRLRTIASLFTYDIDGLIEYVPDPLPVPTRTAQNYKNQKGQGFELEAQWQATDTFTLKGNVAYQRSKDEDTDEIVPEAPELQFYANGHWLFLPDWSLDGQYFWIGGRHRDADDVRPDIDDYDLVNLTLRRKNIFENWEGAVSIRNLFDSDVREPSPVPGVIPNDYPMESRMVWAELRLHF